MLQTRTAPRSRLLAAGVVGAAVLAMMLAGQPAVSAAPGTGTGSVAVVGAEGLAYNYYTDVGLFGGPPTLLGYGQTTGAPFAPATELTRSASAECPEGGGTDSEDKPGGARSSYGPAQIFAGIWPEDSSVAPPSGPLTSEVDCQHGKDGYVTASTMVTLMPEGSEFNGIPHPGGIGPGPLVAEEVYSSCTMNADGTFTSDVTFVNGIVETAYDASTQLPREVEDIPENPEPGYQVEGHLDHIGDDFRITFNEQIENEDGSITVNAAHMELLGPTAVGDMVIGSVTCGPLTTITSADCMRGGWEEHGFRNQGQCLRFVEAEG